MTESKTLVKTVLSPEDLLLHAFQGDEALSQPFVFELTLLNELKRPPVDANALLGTEMTVHVEPAFVNDPALANKPMRYFNGYVSQVIQDGVRGRYRVYRVALRPWLWFLDKTSNCRVFQKLSVPEIVAQVFRKQGFSDFETKLGAYQPRDYCVQYRESDLAFVSRLLEQEGIYYYFRHENGKHTLVLTDGSVAHQPMPQYAEIEFALDHAGDDTLGERVDLWRPTQQLRSGNYALKDYDFKNPQLPLNARLASPKPHPHGALERFDFPGGYDKPAQGERYTRVRLQEEQALFETVEGAGNTHGVGPGFTFRLSKFPVASQNVDHLVLRARYEFAQAPFDATAELAGSPWRCEFTALKASTQFRPARVTARPTIAGLQTAKVVGPKGEEIWTDEFGRIKVQFAWDREGQFDADSSCWIRVAQVWAGGGWGTQHVPRIGNEVVVSFLEGDPDQPLVVGSVYNGANAAPFKLPDNAQISGVKTDSTKNATGYNELSFDDKQGAELITLHAQQDFTAAVERDQAVTVGRNADLTVEGAHTVNVTKAFSLQASVAELRCGPTSIRLTPAGIVITAPTITLASAGAINATAATIQVIGKTTIPVLFAVPLPPVA